MVCVVVIYVKKHYNRPVLITERLNRCNHNNVAEIYPLMLLENVACYCWGFVGGLTFTTEPWNFSWEEAEKIPRSILILRNGSTIYIV